MEDQESISGLSLALLMKLGHTLTTTVPVLTASNASTQHSLGTLIFVIQPAKAYFKMASSIMKIFYNEDPLWDGAGCGPLNTFNNPPWFYKELPEPTTLMTSR